MAATGAGALLNRYNPAQYPLAAGGNDFRGMSLLEIARDCLTRAGVRTANLDRYALAELALHHRAGSHTTPDFPYILADVADKTLRRAYDEAPRTYEPITRQTTVPDFKAVSRVQMGEAPNLVLVGEDGDITYGTIKEAREQIRAFKYSKGFKITEEALINDDMDAFTRVPAMFGAAASRKKADLVWAVVTDNAVLADGVALFHTNHANVVAGPTAPSILTISAGMVLMGKQKGLDAATPLNIQPRYIGVPLEYQTTAYQILFGQLYAATADNAVPAWMKNLTPISDARLSAHSATKWYMFADPSQIDVLETVVLAGGPTDGIIITIIVDPETRGVKVIATLFFGVKAIDYRGMFRNG